MTGFTADVVIMMITVFHNGPFPVITVYLANESDLSDLLLQKFENLNRVRE